MLRALRTLVKPGGDVFVSTINRNLKSYLLAIVGAEYVMNLLDARHTHLRALHPTFRAGPLGARRAAVRRGHRRTRLRSVPEPGTPVHRRRRELHDASAAVGRRRWGSRVSTTVVIAALVGVIIGVMGGVLAATWRRPAQTRVAAPRARRRAAPRSRPTNSSTASARLRSTRPSNGCDSSFDSVAGASCARTAKCS